MKRIVEVRVEGSLQAEVPLFFFFFWWERGRSVFYSVFKGTGEMIFQRVIRLPRQLIYVLISAANTFTEAFKIMLD